MKGMPKMKNPEEMAPDHTKRHNEEADAMMKQMGGQTSGGLINALKKKKAAGGGK